MIYLVLAIIYVSCGIFSTYINWLHYQSRLLEYDHFKKKQNIITVDESVFSEIERRIDKKLTHENR